MDENRKQRAEDNLSGTVGTEGKVKLSYYEMFNKVFLYLEEHYKKELKKQSQTFLSHFQIDKRA